MSEDVDWDKLEKLLLAYLDVGPERLVKAFGVACCFAGTRTTCLTFERLGFQAMPLSVTCIVLNKLWVEQFDAENLAFGELGVNWSQWQKDHAEGLYVCRIGPGPEDAEVNPHTVAIVQNRFLLDVSLAQVNVAPAPKQPNTVNPRGCGSVSCSKSRQSL
jgi:hypothetical protein